MLIRQECIDRIKANEDYITSQFEVKSLRLFGSLARNQQRESSDVDICVEMPPDMFQLIGLKQYLEELLGCDVDVIRMHRNIDNFLLNQIEKDGIYIIREPAHHYFDVDAEVVYSVIAKEIEPLKTAITFFKEQLFDAEPK